jgi:hypothetical protein
LEANGRTASESLKKKTRNVLDEPTAVSESF